MPSNTARIETLNYPTEQLLTKRCALRRVFARLRSNALKRTHTIGDAWELTCSTAKGATFEIVITVNHALPRASASQAFKSCRRQGYSVGPWEKRLPLPSSYDFGASSAVVKRCKGEPTQICLGFNPFRPRHAQLHAHAKRLQVTRALPTFVQCRA